MKAKIKSGHDLLFTQGASNDWSDLRNTMIVNFMDKYTYIDFKQKKNHLLIETEQGIVDIVFTGEIPKLEFNNYCKDQVVLNIL